jgi:PAS domain S-box-containing protein
MILETILSFIVVLIALILVIGIININYLLDFIMQKENRQKLYNVWLLGLFATLIHSSAHIEEALLDNIVLYPTLEIGSLVIAFAAMFTLYKNTLSFYTFEETKSRLVTMHKEAEEKYRMLFENSLDGIYRSTPAGKFIDVNPALVKMLGYESKEELLSVNISKDIYASEGERPTKDERGASHVNRVKKKDGTFIWIESSSRGVSNHSGNVIYEGIVRDITARIRTEEKLQKKIEELEKWQRLTAGRELKMVELKKEIKNLKNKREKKDQPPS